MSAGAGLTSRLYSPPSEERDRKAEKDACNGLQVIFYREWMTVIFPTRVLLVTITQIRKANENCLNRTTFVVYNVTTITEVALLPISFLTEI